jgi:WD40 repeat protein
VTGLLLSCSSDRGIIVWKEDATTKKMMPQLCNIRELKSNNDACWNMRGDKFCVGAASGHVYTGCYNNAVNLWIANSLTDNKSLHDSPVTSVKFDPLSGRVVASSSTDGTVIVSSAYDDQMDTAQDQGPFGKLKSNEILFKFKCTEWVNCVSFSPSGS